MFPAGCLWWSRDRFWSTNLLFAAPFLPQSKSPYSLIHPDTEYRHNYGSCCTNSRYSRCRAARTTPAVELQERLPQGGRTGGLPRPADKLRKVSQAQEVCSPDEQFACAEGFLSLSTLGCIDIVLFDHISSSLIRSPGILLTMSSQITTMKTSTIVAITVGTIVTGFLGTRSLFPQP